MDKCSMTIGLISLPLSIILRAILPDLLAISIFHSIEEFSRINSPITEREWSISLSLVAVDHILCYAVTDDRSSLIDVVQLEHHTLTVVHLAHNLIGHRINMSIESTYAVRRYTIHLLLLLELYPTILSCLIVEQFLLLLLLLLLLILIVPILELLTHVPVVHVLVFVKGFLNVFLSLLLRIFLITIICCLIKRTSRLRRHAQASTISHI